MTTPPLIAPPGATEVPSFDAGWVTGDGTREPFLTYATLEEEVNWSEELETLHEEASRTHFLDRWTRSAILERLGPLPASPTILDAGCSTGYLLEDLRDHHPDAQLIGADLVASGLRAAHGNVPEAALIRADACDLPIADDALDAIVSANLLEHIPDDRRALAEFHRTLKPGGCAVIVVPAGPRTFDYYDRFLGHERRYARGELASKGRNAGLGVVADTHIAATLYPPFWVVKQRNRRTYGHLRGEALEQRVSEDIARTSDSRFGSVLWKLEERAAAIGLPRPFGIRSLVVLRRGAGEA